MPDLTIEHLLLVMLFAVCYMLGRASGFSTGWRDGHAQGMTDNDGWRDEALWWREHFTGSHEKEPRDV